MLECAVQVSATALRPSICKAQRPEPEQGPHAQATARAAGPSMCKGAKARGCARAKKPKCNTVVYISVSVRRAEVVQGYTRTTREILRAKPLYTGLLRFIVCVTQVYTYVKYAVMFVR